MRKVIADLLVLGGVVLCVGGAWQIWMPLGVASAGVACIVLGVLVTLGEK